VIVDCAVYRAGERLSGHDSPNDAYMAGCRHDDAFAWIGLYEPTDEEFARVHTAFRLHPLAVEDAITAHQRPKLDVYDDTLLLVLKPARYLDDLEEVEFGEIQVFVGPSFLVTVRHRPASALGQARRRLEEGHELLSHGPAAALHAIVDHVIDGYAPVIAGLEKDIQEIEREVFSDTRSNPAERIYKLKREVLEFQLATASLLEPLDRLVRRRVLPHLIDHELAEYFRDAHDHLVRVAEQAANFRELLTSVLEANLTQVGVRQNEDMRKISAWVAIIAVPTMIAGIYGMNFKNMPELQWTYSYPIVVVVMLTACLALWRYFRRAGWL
jgi:magnesium transporter